LLLFYFVINSVRMLSDTPSYASRFLDGGGAERATELLEGSSTPSTSKLKNYSCLSRMGRTLCS